MELLQGGADQLLEVGSGSYWLPVTSLGDGRPLQLAAHVIRASEPGPRLALFGGIHGDEPMGPEIVRRLLAEVPESEIRGTIVAIPVANPLAHQALTRNTPLDGCNLNRIFPGDPQGTVSQQLAAVLAQVLKGGVSHFIDFHSGGNFALVDYLYLHDLGAEMSRAFGRPLLYQHESYEGSATDYALSLGVRSMASELGGGSQRIEEYLRLGVEGGLRVLGAIGMVERDTAESPVQQRVVSTLTVLRPSVGGTLLSDYGAATVGEEVGQGTLLGRIVDPNTFEELEVIRAPYDPSILVLVREPVTHVLPGDYGFMVADGATAEPIGLPPRGQP